MERTITPTKTKLQKEKNRTKKGEVSTETRRMERRLVLLYN